MASRAHCPPASVSKGSEATGVPEKEPTVPKPTILLNNAVNYSHGHRTSQTVWTVLKTSFVLVSLFWGYNHFVSKKPSVKDDLTYFTSGLQRQNNLASIEDLPTDSFHKYAQAYCVKSFHPADEVRQLLRKKLNRLPVEVRESIIEIVVEEGVTDLNSFGDSTATFAADGRAHYFKGFYSTVCDDTFTVFKSKMYATCVVASGITFDVAEAVIDYKQETREEVVGVKPCECGYFWCAECPLTKTKTVKTPVFKRHSLTLKQQGQLSEWLRREAMMEAEDVVGTGRTIHMSPPRARQLDDAIKDFAKPDLEGSFYHLEGNASIADI